MYNKFYTVAGQQLIELLNQQKMFQFRSLCMSTWQLQIFSTIYHFYCLKVAALLEYGRILGSAVVVFMIFLSHYND